MYEEQFHALRLFRKNYSLVKNFALFSCSKICKEIFTYNRKKVSSISSVLD